LSAHVMFAFSCMPKTAGPEVSGSVSI
jgi:hypothetical protein